MNARTCPDPMVVIGGGSMNDSPRTPIQPEPKAKLRGDEPVEPVGGLSLPRRFQLGTPLLG